MARGNRSARVPLVPMRGSTARPSVEDARLAAEAVGGVVEEIFGAVTEIHHLFVGCCRSAASEGKSLTEKDIRRVREPVLEMLARSDLPLGLGVVAAPDLLVDQPLWLEWWQYGAECETPSRLEVELNPGRLGFYDYLSAPWFAVPARTGRRHVVGPYVDVYGTDSYVLTFTDPVAVDERFVGVAGADVRASRFESVVLGRLRDAGSDIVVVGDDDRVVVSTSARWLIGSLLPTAEIPDDAVGREVAGPTWRLWAIP